MIRRKKHDACAMVIDLKSTQLNLTKISEISWKTREGCK